MIMKMEKEMMYEAPAVEIFTIEVEQGYEISSDTDWGGSPEP